MKQLTLLFIAFVSFAISVNAQSETKRVVLCEDYNKTTGETIKEGKYWDIENDGEGSFVYLIYNQDKLIKNGLSLYIDKKNKAGSYIAYSTEEFNNDIGSGTKKWAMFDVNFKEEGEYRLTVIGKNAEALAVTYADIKYKKAIDPSDDNKKKRDKIESPDTYYYENSTVTFGESISNGVLSGESTEFRLYGTKKEITAKVEQKEALKLTKVYVDIYTGEKYDEEVSSIGYDVGDVTWDWISVPITFYKKGKYVVDFYTQDDVYINSAYFTVK